MPRNREYGDFEVSGQAALHAGDHVTYMTNTGTVLFIDSHHIDLEHLMPQLKHHSRYHNHSKQPTTSDRNSTNTELQCTRSTRSSMSSTASHQIQTQTQAQTQTQLQLHEAYAHKSTELQDSLSSSSSSSSLATVRLKSHLHATATPHDKILDLATNSTKHLQLQSPSDFRPSALLRQSIGLAGYVAVSLVTIGVDAAQDSYRRHWYPQPRLEDSRV